MGIFTRFKDIVSANMNSMLDKAEDPEKMIRLMIREMEETLVEIKADCAGIMARRKKITREAEEMQSRVDTWDARAKLAVEKGRDDLATEALLEKKRWSERVVVLEQECANFDAMIDQSQDDIGKLEEKLHSAQEKQRMLVQRHARAHAKMRAQNDVRRANGGDAMVRFEKFEQRIERMEAEADLVNTNRKPSLEEEFTLLEGHDDIKKELDELKQGTGKAQSGKKS